MQGVIWTDSTVNTALTGDAAAAPIYSADETFRVKVRTWFVKRPWMKTIIATVMFQGANAGDEAFFKINVNGNDGTGVSTTGPGYGQTESTYDATGLTNGTLYEIILYLSSGGVGEIANMKKPVIGWSV